MSNFHYLVMRVNSVTLVWFWKKWSSKLPFRLCGLDEMQMLLVCLFCYVFCLFVVCFFVGDTTASYVYRKYKCLQHRISVFDSLRGVKRHSLTYLNCMKSFLYFEIYRYALHYFVDEFLNALISFPETRDPFRFHT